MDNDSALIGDMVQRLLTDMADDGLLRAARDGAWPAELWGALEEMGLPLALLSEDQGGFGMEAEDALGLLRLCGRFAVPLPIAETMLGNALLAASGFDPAEGVLSMAVAGTDLQLSAAGGGWQLAGSVCRVPWARKADHILLDVQANGQSMAVVLHSGDWTIATQSTNVAGEPRDDISVNLELSADRVKPMAALGVRNAGSIGVSLKIAGAMQRILEMTVDHANERVQFGRPLSKFQAIQHELAKLASEAAACGAAADMATDAFSASDGMTQLVIAAVRLRCGEAAGIVNSIAHQTHGAIGFTAEHRLHHFTNGLWAWRDEYGSAPSWARILGRAALAQGPDGYWPFVTAA